MLILLNFQNVLLLIIFYITRRIKYEKIEVEKKKMIEDYYLKKNQYLSLF